MAMKGYTPRSNRPTDAKQYRRATFSYARYAREDLVLAMRALRDGDFMEAVRRAESAAGWAQAIRRAANFLSQPTKARGANVRIKQ